MSVSTIPNLHLNEAPGRCFNAGARLVRQPRASTFSPSALLICPVGESSCAIDRPVCFCGPGAGFRLTDLFFSAVFRRSTPHTPSLTELDMSIATLRGTDVTGKLARGGRPGPGLASCFWVQTPESTCGVIYRLCKRRRGRESISVPGISFPRLYHYTWKKPVRRLVFRTLVSRGFYVSL